MSPKLFALIDCNNFFVSCERIFRPDLNSRPVIVLSNNDGCVVSRSNESKALGIPMGIPLFDCKDIVERFNIAVFSSNFALYGDISARVMKILSSFVEDIEIYSIDEAFLSLDKTLIRDPLVYAKKIRETIFKYTGIPVSIGLGRTKTLAKSASKIAKKEASGTFFITEENKNIHFSKFSTIDIWGIGYKSSNKLKQLGIFTAADFLNAEKNIIKKIMGVTGERIWLELNGTSSIPMSSLQKTKHGILNSRSFGTPVTSFTELSEAVSLFTENAAVSLRKENAAASVVGVFVRSSKHSPEQYKNFSYVTLGAPTFFTPQLIGAALNALKQIYKPGIKYKKCGVFFTGIAPKGEEQIGMFTPEQINLEYEKHKNLMDSIDKINKKNQGRIFFAAQGVKKRWKPNRKNLSPLYTTNWEEIPVVS